MNDLYDNDAAGYPDGIDEFDPSFDYPDADQFDPSFDYPED